MNRTRAHLDSDRQTNSEWLEGAIGRKVLVALSGASGAILYIFIERYLMAWLK